MVNKKSKVGSRKSKAESRKPTIVWLALLLLTFNFRLSTLCAQQPQAQSGQPIYAVNAKYVNGVAPGYWPTAGAGLVLNLSAGTSFCGNPPAAVNYAGGTLTLTASQTNYVYLDPAASCAPAFNTTGFSPGQIPLANVVTSGSAITSITDVRTWFVDPNTQGLTVRADLEPGANAGAKIAACVAALPATGGICDARGLVGAQSFSSNPFSGVIKPVTLLTGNATYSWDTSTISVVLPSHFHWIGYGTTLTSSAPYVYDNSTGDLAIVQTKRYSTTGSITSGTPTLTVSDATGFEVGSIAAVLGAAPTETKQATTINQGGGIGAGDSSFTVASTAGWGLEVWSPNYLIIDSEIIRASGGTVTTFTGVTRGLFGTTAASHADTTPVYAIGYFFSRITNVSGTTITLEDNASRTVTNATVVAGNQDIGIEGELTIDGKTDGSTQRTLDGISFVQSVKAYVAPTVKIMNIDRHGVIVESGSRDALISGAYSGNGIAGMGTDVVLFGSSSYNKVDTVSHRNGQHPALLIDDRTTIYTPDAGASNGNVAHLGPIVNYGYVGAGGQIVAIEGSNYNTVYVPSLKSNQLAGLIGLDIRAGQWTTNPSLHGNTYYFGFVDVTGGTSLHSSDYTPSAPFNSFIGGFSLGTPSTLLGDVVSYGGGSGIGAPATTNLESALAVAKYWNPATNDYQGTVAPAQALTVTNLQPGGYDPVIIWRMATDTGVAKPAFVIGAAGASSWTNGNLATQIADVYLLSRGTDGNLYERLRISSAGNLGIGKSPGLNAQLDVAKSIVSGLNPVSFSATPTFDASLGNTQKITLTNNVTSSTLSSATAGETINFIICQDSGGSHTFVWPTTVKGGMTIGATLSTCSAQSFIFDGTNAYALSPGMTSM